MKFTALLLVITLMCSSALADAKRRLDNQSWVETKPGCTRQCYGCGGQSQCMGWVCSRRLDNQSWVETKPGCTSQCYGGGGQSQCLGWVCSRRLHGAKPRPKACRKVCNTARPPKCSMMCK